MEAAVDSSWKESSGWLDVIEDGTAGAPNRVLHRVLGRGDGWRLFRLWQAWLRLLFWSHVGCGSYQG
jgi:hypothetical protein